MGKDMDQCARLVELLQGEGHIMMLTTHHDGRLFSRPMALQQVDADGTLWFFNSKSTEKTWEIRVDDRVNASFANPEDNTFVSVSGTANLVNDPSMVRALWNPALKAWFEGPEDPNIQLIRVDMDSAEYWTQAGGKFSQAMQMLGSAITGKNLVQNENERVVSR